MTREARMVPGGSHLNGPMHRKFRRFATRRRQRKFLRTYERFLSICMATDVCGISARIVHKWRRNNPWFEARFKHLPEYLYGGRRVRL